MGAGARGQATVESVGIAVAIVLALAAMTTWLVGAVRPAAAPLDPVGRVAAPLATPERIGHWPVPIGAEPDEPIGDALRAFGRGARAATRAWLAGRREFSGAYNRRLRRRALAILRDPLAGFGVPGPDALSPLAVARRALAQRDRLRDYVRRLRAMPRGERTRTLLRDAGTGAADATVEVLEALARRRLAGGATGAR